MARKVLRKADAPLVVALAAGATNVDAARIAGVSERTVRRRMRDPGFVKAVKAQRERVMAQAVAMVADAGTEAARTLRRLLDADSENVQLGAARSILELGAKLREAEELEKRIAELEQKAQSVARNDW